MVHSLGVSVEMDWGVWCLYHRWFGDTGGFRDRRSAGLSWRGARVLADLSSPTSAKNLNVTNATSYYITLQ